MTKVLDQLKEHQSVMSQLHPLLPLIEQAADTITYALSKGGKILLMGNGEVLRMRNIWLLNLCVASMPIGERLRRLL